MWKECGVLLFWAGPCHALVLCAPVEPCTSRRLCVNWQTQSSALLWGSPAG